MLLKLEIAKYVTEKATSGHVSVKYCNASTMLFQEKH